MSLRKNQRKNQRDVHGIVLLDKPQGLSSNEALQEVKRLCRANKAGHTGSLDPMATGLLPICLGEATKIAGRLLGSHKAYEAECLLGVRTDTDDAEGEEIERQTVPDLSDDDIREALSGFIGAIEQVPPAFSALKRDGVPMYVRARRGEVVEQVARTVHVHAIDWLDRSGPRLRLRVECGSGTYIRSLARDLGEKLGCGAHLVSLRRLWVDPFQQPQMHTLDDLRELATSAPEGLDGWLLPLEEGLARVPMLVVNAAQADALKHGQRIQVDGPMTGTCRVHAQDSRLLALAERDDTGRLRILRGFNLPPATGLDGPSGRGGKPC